MILKNAGAIEDPRFLIAIFMLGALLSFLVIEYQG